VTPLKVDTPVENLLTRPVTYLTAHQHNIRLYSAIHVGSRWKIQDRRQI